MATWHGARTVSTNASRSAHHPLFTRVIREAAVQLTTRQVHRRTVDSQTSLTICDPFKGSDRSVGMPARARIPRMDYALRRTPEIAVPASECSMRLIVDCTQTCGPPVCARIDKLGTEDEQADRLGGGFHTAGALPPLFCACAGGGDILDYRDLALALPKDQPVYVFGVPPSRRANSSPRCRGSPRIYIAEARKRQPHGPYRLCGHSFGGLVVYEMAVLLPRLARRSASSFYSILCIQRSSAT